MKNVRKSYITLILMLFLSPLVFAIELQEAKDKGLVGETLTGYLAATSNRPSAEVSSLVADINRKRKVRYEEVAKQVGKPLEIVEQLAGEKAQSKTQPGHYIQTASGEWVKK